MLEYIKLEDMNMHWSDVLDKAAKCGMTAEEFIISFLKDLLNCEEKDVYEENERGNAYNWFSHYFEKNTDVYNSYYLNKLIQANDLDCFDLDDFLDGYKEITENKKYIKHKEREQEKGVVIHRGIEMPWTGIVDSDGKQRYSSIEEWREAEKEYLEETKEEICDIWEYMMKRLEKDTVDEKELKKLLVFCDKYIELIEENDPYIEDESLKSWSLKISDLEHLVKLYDKIKDTEKWIEEQKATETPIMFIRDSELDRDEQKWELFKFSKKHLDGKERTFRDMICEIEKAVEYHTKMKQKGEI